MAVPKKQADASFKSKSYEAQRYAWEIVNDVFQGTDTIRARGKKYLPQEPGEKDDAYKNRLARAVFYNAYRRTVEALVGMVFRKNPQPGEDVPKQTLDHFENIDLMGTHLDVFAKEVFRTAVNDGHAFILVDMGKSVKADNPNATLADERSLGLRPYWVLINKSQVINWRTQIMRNGEVRLTQVTICEKRIEADGDFGEIENTYYRVLRPGSFVLYKANSTGRTNSLDAVDQGETGLDQIPLIPVYTGKCGYFESKPPLYDVAHLNLKYYRLDSDYDHILHVANVPILCAKGRDETQKKVKVGPNSLVDVDVNGDLFYVEHAGQAIGAARQAMQDLKQDMARLGLSLIAPKAEVQQTATEQILDRSEQDSELAGMARNLQDALETAMVFHARFLGEKSSNSMKEGGSITVNREFIRFALDAQMILALSTLVATSQITLDALWDVLERGGVLPEGFDRSAARDQIAADALSLTGSTREEPPEEDEEDEDDDLPIAA